MGNQYQVHSILALYQKYGIHKASSVESPPPTAQSIYIQQKKQILQEINQLKGNSLEARRLEKFLNFTDSLGKTKPSNQHAEREAIFNSIREDISNIVGTKVTKTLSISDEVKADSALVRKKYQEVEESMKELFEQSKKEGTISLGQLNKMIQRFENAYKHIPKNPTEKNEKDFLQAYKSIVSYLAMIDEKTMYRKRGTGVSLKLKDFENITAKEFIDALNKASNLLTYGSLSGIIGKIGELFGASATFLFFNQNNKGTVDVINDFVKRNKNNSNIEITGDDKSIKIFESEIGTRFTQTKKASDINGNVYAVSTTDDKVDFTITVPDNRSTLNFSMKNYANANEISLLKGNIFPILDEYPSFLYHFINLSNLNNASNDANLLYQAAKYTVAVKALIGGVRAMNNNGQIFKTATADYLIVNENKKNNGFRVYSTGQICNKLNQNLNSLIKFSHPFNYPVYTENPKYDARFANMHVSLRMGELKKTISK